MASGSVEPSNKKSWRNIFAPLRRNFSEGKSHRNAGNLSIQSGSVTSVGAIAGSRSANVQRPQSQSGPNSPPSNPSHLPAQAPTPSLWERACEEIEKTNDYRGFVEKYQKLLLKDNPSAPTKIDVTLAARREQMLDIISNQEKRLQTSQWSTMISGRSSGAMQAIETIVHGIAYGKGVIDTIVQGTGDPHAAMAWAGVSVLLPLITSPVAQRADAIELLSTITNRMQRYHVLAETFRADVVIVTDSDRVADLRSHFESRLVSLYADILKAQISLACKFARSGFLQYGRDIIKYDNWLQMRENIIYKGKEVEDDACTLEHALSGQSFKLIKSLEEGQVQVDKQLKMQAQHNEATENKQFLLYFSSELHPRDVKDRIPVRLEGTLDWAADDASFTSWRDSAFSETLLVKGGAGHGKSVFLKYLLEEHISANQTRVTSYFFFRRGSDLEQSALECVNALLYQMLEQSPDLVTLARRQYPYASQNTRFHFEELCEIVQFCLESVSTAVIWVIDGLDECWTLSSRPADPQLYYCAAPDFVDDERILDRNRFFTFLAKAAKQDRPRLKLLLSARTGSRDAFDVSETFQDIRLQEIDLNALGDNARKDIQAYINGKVSALKMDVMVSNNLKSLLYDFQKDSGSYLWLRLMFVLLREPRYRNMSWQSIEQNLTHDNIGTVGAIFERLLPGKEKYETSRIIFTILLGARRVLTDHELNDVVEIVTGHDLSLQIPNVLATYCGAIVEINTVDQKKKTVNFIHEEARRFLLKDPESDRLPQIATMPSHIPFHHAFEAESVASSMLDICIRYLTAKGAKPSLDENLKYLYDHQQVQNWISRYLGSNPFMRYAAIQWINHLPFDTTDSQEREKVKARIERLCDLSTREFRTWFACCWAIWSPKMDLKQFLRDYVTAFVGDHLHPDKEVMSKLDLYDPLASSLGVWSYLGYKDLRWYWTASQGLWPLSTLLNKCRLSYVDERRIELEVTTLS